MVRIAIDVVAVCELDYLAEVHYRDALADMLDHAQVVGNEKISQAKLLLEILQEIYYLRLNRDVERRDGFIKDEKPWTDGKRPGNTDTLSLTAREFVGVMVERLTAHPDHLEQLPDALFFVAAAGELMNLDAFAHDRPHSHPRIQR